MYKRWGSFVVSAAVSKMRLWVRAPPLNRYLNVVAWFEYHCDPGGYVIGGISSWYGLPWQAGLRGGVRQNAIQNLYEETIATSGNLNRKRESGVSRWSQARVGGARQQVSDS